ncbi:probable cytochrome P450 12a4, mitochondrial [Physella acuta]|uniref:probable cytochrome P450 12a4, mitochondrial n=1 Tax=Physella acuta TaxID=109671 RepID=UPI0027DE5C99|nr:probable cytochrome P450 12a4, mitochondrial [Physella acuta]
MQYLKACVKESFRLLYPISGVMRVLPCDVVLSNYHIPAGVQILLANALTCQQNFHDPLTYLPERWLRSEDGHLDDVIPKHAVLPFGYGPRNCIGRRFSKQELYHTTVKVRA